MTTKFEDIERLSLDRNICSPEINSDIYWPLVDSFDINAVITIANWWLPKTKGLISGAVFAQAQDILYWYQEKRFLTDKQRRWLVNSIIESWSDLDLRHLSQVIYAY